MKETKSYEENARERLNLITSYFDQVCCVCLFKNFGSIKVRILIVKFFQTVGEK